MFFVIRTVSPTDSATDSVRNREEFTGLRQGKKPPLSVTLYYNFLSALVSVAWHCSPASNPTFSRDGGATNLASLHRR